MLFKHCWLALALAPLSFAGSFTVQSSTSSVLKCSTSYGPRSITPPLQTTTATKTISFLASVGTSVSTPISTVTPPPITQTGTTQTTVTVTTTNTAVTDTFSTTTTIFTTTTQSTVVTSTSTVTSTFSETTTTNVVSTVPTSSGFLPVESTTATAYPNSPMRFMARDKLVARDEPVARDELVARGEVVARNELMAREGRKGGICKSSYPQGVYCTKYIEILFTIIYVRTTTTSTTTLAPATSTTTITVTATSTSTVVPPDVSTTSSFTTTVTVSTDTTSTAHTTVTTSTTSTLTITSTSTVYAACTSLSSNILGPQSPNGLIEAITGTNSFIISNPATPYDCCVDCQLSNTCAGTFFSVGSQDQYGQCIQVQSGQCSSQSAFSRKVSPTLERDWVAWRFLKDVLIVAFCAEDRRVFGEPSR
ncbi:MAG: hypothetical protein M1824_003804 [Vezdaea acicularis]|nr:MAG: hypothetical protein M1824_003804 [Vezdaea acicularis]